MIVILDRKDLLNLIRGSYVPYEMMKDRIISKMGSYSGSYDRMGLE